MARAVDDPVLSTFGRLAEVYLGLEVRLGKDLQDRHDLPHVWFEVLIRLARSPDGRLTMGELGQQITLTSGGVTRLVDRMQAAGLVDRTPCPTDRRVSFAQITPAGRATVEKAARSHARNLRAVFAPLTPEELTTLDTLLDRLRPPR